MNRIQKVQSCLGKWGVDLLIVDNPTDLFYLVGKELSLGRLVISASDAILYVDGRYYESCKESLEVGVGKLAEAAIEAERIGFDGSFTTFTNYEKLKELKGGLVPLSNPLLAIREVKEAGEIEYLRQAAALGSRGYDFVVSQLREGVTEEQLAIELEVFWRKAGGERVAFAPHIAFGENSAFPHHHASKRALKQGDLVLIDIGVVLNHYHSDMTRVVFFGEANSELQTIYDIVRDGQQKALDICKPGTPLADLDRAARDHIASKGYGEFFLHSLGHGVGLDIHEAPTIRSNTPGVLKEGMVITIEPGIYLAGKGGVRLEDTVAITSKGFDNLTTG